MAATDLKANFQNQMKEIDEKIIQIRNELKKAEEYKLKLVGGLETLELIEQQETGEVTHDFSSREFPNQETRAAENPEDDLGRLPESTEE